MSPLATGGMGRNNSLIELQLLCRRQLYYQPDRVRCMAGVLRCHWLRKTE
jgi:hypothetical protein